MLAGETLHTALCLRERVPGKAVRTPSPAAGNRSVTCPFPGACRDNERADAAYAAAATMQA